MQRNCATFFCVLLILSLTISTLAERKCAPGKNYHDGCNFCRCAGQFTACTLKACLEFDEATGKVVSKPRLEPPEDFWLPDNETEHQ